MTTSSCQQCARMLKHILAQENSRPLTILEAIGGKQGQEDDTMTSVEMKIPRSSTIPSGRGSPLSTPSSSSFLKENGRSMMSTASISTADIQVRADEISDNAKFESLKIECRPCADTGPESNARAFVMGPSPLSIVLCSNRLSFHNTREVEEVLVHELIHVYDVRVHRLDLRLCENLAYSEIRAARDAECKDVWLAGRYCVPSKAFLATSNLFPAHEAKECLARVFVNAMADTAPLKPTSKPSSRCETNQQAMGYKHKTKVSEETSQPSQR